MRVWIWIRDTDPLATLAQDLIKAGITEREVGGGLEASVSGADRRRLAECVSRRVPQRPYCEQVGRHLQIEEEAMIDSIPEIRPFVATRRPLVFGEHGRP